MTRQTSAQEEQPCRWRESGHADRCAEFYHICGVVPGMNAEVCSATGDTAAPTAVLTESGTTAAATFTMPWGSTDAWAAPATAARSPATARAGLQQVVRSC